MEFRTVITGHDEEGSARVLSDSMSKPVTISMRPSLEIHRVWELPAAPSLPVRSLDEGSPAGPFFPPSGAARFGVICILPGEYGQVPEERRDVALEEMETKLPGFAAVFNPERPGFHETSSVDWVVVLAGKGRLQVGESDFVDLVAGDCVVQNGTEHAWENTGDDPFVIFYTLLGADQADSRGLE